jgi:hypothetical protein
MFQLLFKLFGSGTEQKQEIVVEFRTKEDRDLEFGH